MNFNFFKRTETSKDGNAVEEIKNVNEAEVSQEEEISLERIDALKEYDKEVAEITAIEESDIENALQDSEKVESLGKKMTTLKKVAETLKDYAPAILAGAAAITGIAVLANMDLPVSFDEMTNSGGYQAEKLKVFLVAMPTIAAGLMSLLTGLTVEKRNYTEETTENNNSVAA